MGGISKTAFANRMHNACCKLVEEGFDALVVYARGSTAAFGSKSHGYMRYLVDWDTYYSPGVLVLAPGRAPVCITSDVFLQKLSQDSAHPCEDVRFAPLADLAQAVSAVLREQAAAMGRAVQNIAFIGKTETPVPFWELFAGSLEAGSTITDFERAFDLELAVKDAEQYALHKQAAAVCDAMYAELDRSMYSGKSIWHLRAVMEKTARDAGAEHVLIWLTVAPVAASCFFYREDSTYVPQIGDQVLCGIYVLLYGHWGHGIRMGSCGQPTKAMLQGYDIVREMQDEAVKNLRPGADLQRVNAAMEDVFARHFPEETGIFRFRAAHGLGHFSEDPLTTDPFRHSYAPGVVTETPFIEIRKGMLFEVHPNYFQAGVTGAALGDMVYLSDTGPTFTLQFPREFRQWGS